MQCLPNLTSELSTIKNDSSSNYYTTLLIREESASRQSISGCKPSPRYSGPLLRYLNLISSGLGSLNRSSHASVRITVTDVIARKRIVSGPPLSPPIASVFEPVGHPRINKILLTYFTVSS
jgi:hypothetical protein